jgi:hypothetical protein
VRMTGSSPRSCAYVDRDSEAFARSTVFIA